MHLVQGFQNYPFIFNVKEFEQWFSAVADDGSGLFEVGGEWFADVMYFVLMGYGVGDGFVQKNTSGFKHGVNPFKWFSPGEEPEF